MPLIKGKSQKSFVKNLKTELEHGHPMKQSLAIAYSMKRKAQHKAKGGHIKGVHEENPYPMGGPHPGESKAGDHTRWGLSHEYSKNPAAAKRAYDKAKMEHHKVLEEGRKIHPKLKGLADGGPVLPGAEDFVKGFKGATKPYAEGGSVSCPSCGYMAEGGEVPGEHKASTEGKHIEHEEKMQPVDADLGEYHAKHNEMAHHDDDKSHMHGQVPHKNQDDMISRIMRKRSPTFESEARNYSEGGKVANNTHPFECDFEDPNEFDDLVLRDDLDFNYTGANSGDEIGNEREDHDRHDIVSRIMASRRKKDRNPKPA